MSTAATSSSKRFLTLELLKTQVIKCRRCPLGHERLQAVFGVGNPFSKVIFLGEGPGFDEDHRGEPFIGRAGQLLNQMIEDPLGLTRKDVYISNVVKCHPMINPKTPDARANDRPPKPEELEACDLWWRGEVEIIKPKVICLLGASAVRALYGEKATISAYRGKATEHPSLPGITIFPIYHPAAILRNPGLRDAYKNDFLALKKLLETT